MLEDSASRTIAAARDGDEAAFRELLAPLHRELLAYAYRMMGGFQDAEEAVQEAQLKAWRAIGSWEPRGSFRGWLYRILTNTCLDLLRSRARRVVPRDVGPATVPGPPLGSPRDDIAWIEPYPDALLPSVTDPEAAARLRQSVRLAFVRATQLLPARQRAALVLHDVLDFSVDLVAETLETSVPATNSLLQRARATIGTAAREPRPEAAAQEADAVRRLVSAWETGDFDHLVALLAEDARMSMPPWAFWLDGRDAVAAAFRSPGTWEGEPGPGRYRMVPTAMNGQPAAMAYVRNPEGRYVAMCLTVLELDLDGRIVDLSVFVLPQHHATWGFPPALDTAITRSRTRTRS